MASQLSPRQREILDLVAEGRTSKEIAVTLGISESTVNWHLANAFERLGASSRAEAVALAIRSNSAAPVPALAPPSARAPMPTAWPRLVAIAIAIALAGALLGGATVATFHLGQAPLATATPPTRSDGTATSSPERSAGRGNPVEENAPANSDTEATVDATRTPQPNAAPTLPPLPALSAPPVPTVPITVPTPVPALPSLPVTPPAVATPSLPPLPIPTPTLPIP